MVDLGGGGDEPTPNPAGGGDSIRILTSCNNAACQFVEVGLHHPMVVSRLHMPFAAPSMPDGPRGMHGLCFPPASHTPLLRCSRAPPLIACWPTAGTPRVSATGMAA